MGCARPAPPTRGRRNRFHLDVALQVKGLREQHGYNRLTPPKERSEIVKFLLQV
jgi:hypothetical protein